MRGSFFARKQPSHYGGPILIYDRENLHDRNSPLFLNGATICSFTLPQSTTVLSFFIFFSVTFISLLLTLVFRQRLVNDSRTQIYALSLVGLIPLRKNKNSHPWLVSFTPNHIAVFFYDLILFFSFALHRASSIQFDYKFEYRAAPNKNRHTVRISNLNKCKPIII